MIRVPPCMRTVDSAHLGRQLEQRPQIKIEATDWRCAQVSTLPCNEVRTYEPLLALFLLLLILPSTFSVAYGSNVGSVPAHRFAGKRRACLKTNRRAAGYR